MKHFTKIAKGFGKAVSLVALGAIIDKCYTKLRTNAVGNLKIIKDENGDDMFFEVIDKDLLDKSDVIILRVIRK